MTTTPMPEAAWRRDGSILTHYAQAVAFQDAKVRVALAIVVVGIFLNQITAFQFIAALVRDFPSIPQHALRKICPVARHHENMKCSLG